MKKKTTILLGVSQYAKFCLNLKRFLVGLFYLMSTSIFSEVKHFEFKGDHQKINGPTALFYLVNEVKNITSQVLFSVFPEKSNVEKEFSKFIDSTPELNTTIPVSGASNVNLSQPIILEFNEEVMVGAGFVRIVQTELGVFEEIDVADVNSVSVSGAQILIEPKNFLKKGTNYHIEIDSTAFKDVSGNFFTGISDSQTYFFTTVDVVINEVVTDPQQDWSSNGFDGSIGSGAITNTDEWVELYIKSNGIDFTDWTIELIDGTNFSGDLTSTGAFDESVYLSSGSGSFFNSEAGDYLILGNPDGSSAMNNTILIVLKDSGGAIVDQVQLGGQPGEAPNGNATDISNESVKRVPDGKDTDDDTADFKKSNATIGGEFDNYGFSITSASDPMIVSEAGTTSSFTVVLDAAPESDVVFDITSDDVGEVFVSPTNITFTPSTWDQPQMVTVSGVDDAIVDGTQTATITVALNDSISDDNFDDLSSQTLSVENTDNDSAGFSLSTPSNPLIVSETGTTSSFTVVLDVAPESDVVFDITSDDVGEVFVSPATITFTPSTWDQPQMVTVSGVDDAILDGIQTTIITIAIDDSTSDDNFDDLSSQTIQVSNTDNDLLHVQLKSTTTKEGDFGDTNLEFTVTLHAPAAFPFTIDYSSIDQSAHAGNDYAGVTGTLHFEIGETNKSIVVPIHGDMQVEHHETFMILLSNPSESIYFENNSAIGTIENDDQASVMLTNKEAYEADGQVVITATLDHAVENGFVIYVSTSNGSAKLEDNDYRPIQEVPIHFIGSAGETHTVELEFVDDDKVEGDESFRIMIHHIEGTNYPIDISSSATLTIRNDDKASVTLLDVEINEDDGAQAIVGILDNAVEGGFSVDVVLEEYTAFSEDNDYLQVGGKTLNFRGDAGEKQQILLIPLPDEKVEKDEKIRTRLDNLRNTNLDIDISSESIITLLNDDEATIQIDHLTKAEGNNGITDFVFTVSLNGDVDSGFTVNYTTVDQSATLVNEDYNKASGKIDFQGYHEESHEITVGVLGDTIEEGEETFHLVLTNIESDGRAIRFTSDIGVGTILNEDDNTAPEGFRISWNQTLIGRTDRLATGFTLEDAEVGATYNYMITSNGGAGEVKGSGIVISESKRIDNIDLSSLADGLLLKEVTLTDPFGNKSKVQTDTAVLDTKGAIPSIQTSITQPTNAAFEILIRFDEEVTEFSKEDLSVTNAEVSEFRSITTSEYWALIEPITNGEVSVFIDKGVAIDLAQNDNEASNKITVIYDDTSPTIEINTSVSDQTNSSFEVTVTFSEPIIGFDPMISPIVSNGTIINAIETTTDTEWVLEIMPQNDGEVSVFIEDGVAMDQAQNDNKASNKITVNYDGTSPEVDVHTTASNLINSSFEVTITFSESITGFEPMNSPTVINGIITNATETIIDTQWVLEIMPQTDGEVSVFIDEAVASDTAKNDNEASNKVTLSYDGTSPTTYLSTLTNSPLNAAFEVDIRFSEVVFGFDSSDVLVANGSLSDFKQESPSTYKIIITPIEDGPLFIDVIEGVATDAAGNPNIEISLEVEVDLTPPDPPTIEGVSEITCFDGRSITGDNTLEIFGTAEAGSIVEIFIDNDTIGSVYANDQGYYVFDYSDTVLTDGLITITAIASDSLGNKGAVSTPFEIIIDTVDFDGDGIPDVCDEDMDGNGILDIDEDCDNDGVVDGLDNDIASCKNSIKKINARGFSPNEDGINDTFIIEDIELFPNNTLSIYSRSGKLVFRKKSYNNDWEGFSNQAASTSNKKLPVGPYIYIIDFGDGSAPTKGWIYINY